MVRQSLGQTETTFLQFFTARVGQDLQASLRLSDDFLHSQALQWAQLLLGLAEVEALLQGEEDAGGREKAGPPVGEAVLHAGVGDDALRHPPELGLVHCRGEVEPGYDVVQVVKGGGAGQFPPQLLKN